MNWRRLVFSEYIVLALSVAWFLAMIPIAPGMASPANLGNIISSALPLLAVATGQTVVLITGGIDLSATAAIALASTCGGLLMSADRGWLAGSPWAAAAGVALMLAIGLAIGIGNGIGVSRLGMPPFIVTLTGMIFFSGFAVWLTRSMNVTNLPAGFLALGKQVWIALLLCGGLGVAIHLLLSRSVFGRWFYAVGANPRTSRVSGVPVNAVLVSAYAISGLCAATGSVVYTARLETGSPVMGQRILLDVIGAVVIGGTSLFGGRGRVLWTVFGVLFMALIDNTFNLLGLSNFSVLMAKGAVILFAALLDAARSRHAGA
jgi:ribose transport system permease protein